MDEVIPKDPKLDWENCPLQTLLNRIQRITHNLRFCRGRAKELYPLLVIERQRLLDIYSKRLKVKEKNEG
jgi:hypothetical protein